MAALPTGSRDDSCIQASQIIDFDDRLDPVELGRNGTPLSGYAALIEDLAMGADGTYTAVWLSGGQDGSRTAACPGEVVVGPQSYRFVSQVVGWELVEAPSCGSRTSPAGVTISCRPTGDTNELVERRDGQQRVIAAGVFDLVLSPMTHPSPCRAG